MKRMGVLFFLILMVGMVWGVSTVFNDNFSTYTNTSWTTTGQIGSSSWYVNRSGEDWGARRNSSPEQLELNNDVSSSTNQNGWVFCYTNTSNYSEPYHTTLSSNLGIITWSFNMRQIRTDPAGFGSGNYGVAYILGGTSSSVNNTGTGYVILLGQSGNTDPIRFGKYSNGLQGTLTNLIISNTSGLTDFGNEYLSIKVSYNPSNDLWELFLRNDGSSSFSDPSTGILISQGTITDNDYTNMSLENSGAYWQGSTLAYQTSFFDNVLIIIEEFTPTISLSTSSLSGFTYEVGSGPSAEQTFTVSGSNLTADISMTAPTNYEISKTSGSGYTSPLTFAQSGGTVTETTVYVRLKAGLSIGSYNDETITASSEDADDKTVTCSGSVIPEYDYEEYFDNFPETGSNYNTGTFTGVDGSTWNYVKTSGQQAIDSPTPLLGMNQDPQATVYSGELIYGIKQLEFDYKQTFSTNVNLEVYVNDTKVYTATSNSEQGVVKNSGIIDVNMNQISVIKFIQPSGAGQVSIDNLKWSNMSDTPLPVTLSSFTVHYAKNNVILKWTTESETDNLGWNIFRSEAEKGYENQDYLALNAILIDGMGTTTTPTNYNFADEYPVIEGRTYWYWLQSVSTTNELELFGPVSLDIPFAGQLPVMTILQTNYPNPFNPQTTIEFNIIENEKGILTIYNLKGERILTETFTTGNHKFIWNAEGLASGIYFYKLSSPTTNMTRKMLLMK